MTSGHRKVGRRKGGHNRGYWFRKGRGWYVTENGKPVRLLDETGQHIKSRDADSEILRTAWGRHVTEKGDQAKRGANRDLTTLEEVCCRYLDYAKINNRPSTFSTRANFLFDFCSGLPARFRDKGDGRARQKPTERDRVHPGYGDMTIANLMPLHVENWLNSHPTWGDGGRRIAVQALKRALNYYRKATGDRTSNPIKGMAVGKCRARLTYFDDSQEQAMYRHARKPLALAIQILIRTGARYGSEFCRLTTKHIEETPKGMVWRFSSDEHKTGTQTTRPRVIYVASDIADIVRRLVKRCRKGERVFRNSRGKPWNPKALRVGFERLRAKLKKAGIKLDDDSCLYSCRHTFAKRTLTGYWTGKPCTLEYLSKLMGNSRAVCEKYAEWCPAYTDPLWDAIG